jgi:DNA-binding transcriptional regulator YiaG
MNSPDEIRSLRLEHALSQEALAKRLGVSVRTVARWEGGVSRPSSLALDKLRQAMFPEDGQR